MLRSITCLFIDKLVNNGFRDLNIDISPNFDLQ